MFLIFWFGTSIILNALLTTTFTVLCRLRTCAKMGLVDLPYTSLMVLKYLWPQTVVKHLFIFSISLTSDRLYFVYPDINIFFFFFEYWSLIFFKIIMNVVGRFIRPVGKGLRHLFVGDKFWVIALKYSGISVS